MTEVSRKLLVLEIYTYDFSNTLDYYVIIKLLNRSVSFTGFLCALKQFSYYLQIGRTNRFMESYCYFVSTRFLIM